MKNSIKRLTFIIALVMLSIAGFSQTVTKLFYGQNAWMPDSIGTRFLNGKLHKNWGNIGASGSGLIRFGGIAPDYDMPTNHQYIKMVDSARAKGMDIMLQVPFAAGKYNASQAAAIVKYVNITMGKKVKYWVIGNEPNLKYSYTNSTQVAKYLKEYSAAMKAVDPSIILVGPETAWYDRGIINGLTTPGGPDDVTGKDANGNYIIDIISFHTYPFSGGQNRNDVLTNLTKTNGLEENLAELKARLETCNKAHGREGANAVRMAITELNIDYANPANDNLNGTGGQSFIGGQFWAEMMGISMKKGVAFVNFWSTIEGGNNVQDIGYISHSTGKKKPSYYHFQMMAKNLLGTPVEVTDNQQNVKVFATKGTNEVAVMIMNQDQVSNYNYTLGLSNNKVSGNSLLTMNVNAGVSKEYTDAVSAQSTVVVVFDMQGNILRKIEYKLNGHADADKAPTETIYKESTPNTGNGNTTAVDDQGREIVPFKTYPNPMTTHFIVESSAKENAKLEVYNIAGQLVMSKALNIENGMVKQRVEIDQNVASGTYIVRANIDGKAHTSKMLLTK